ncbi:MAG: MarR family transcriptional regulator [Oscillospiraceae bacterium]|jgi:DNA-binding MarR family transcriptional regulator|nr:MarR family transcriptional regulator [Oscillospiraceae bacterium]
MSETKNKLQDKMSRIYWLTWRQSMQKYVERGPQSDPTRGQGRVLAILKIQSSMSARDLSYLLGIRPQSLNDLLVKLEKNGYITRAQSTEDRRSVIVSLTDKGREEKQNGADSFDVFDSFTAEEQNTLDGYLDRILTTLEGKLTADECKPYAEWETEAKEKYGENFEKLLNFRRDGRPQEGNFTGFGGNGFGFGATGFNFGGNYVPTYPTYPTEPQGGGAVHPFTFPHGFEPGVIIPPMPYIPPSQDEEE